MDTGGSLVLQKLRFKANRAAVEARVVPDPMASEGKGELLTSKMQKIGYAFDRRHQWRRYKPRIVRSKCPLLRHHGGLNPVGSH